MRACVILLAGLVCGCQQMDVAQNFPNFDAMSKREFLRPWKKKDSEPIVPQKITAIWTHTVLNQVGKPGVRGFGGRVMFYGDKDAAPGKVDGKLVVYAFDDSDVTHNQPIRRFEFTQEDLHKHYSESEIGASYSFWLPWDEVGGPVEKISLMARFEPVGAPAVLSENSRHVLPGVATGKEDKTMLAKRRQKDRLKEYFADNEDVDVSPRQKKRRNSGIQLASYEDTGYDDSATPDESDLLNSEYPTNGSLPASYSTGANRPTTVTIGVPAGFAERNFRSGSAGMSQETYGQPVKPRLSSNVTYGQPRYHSSNYDEDYVSGIPVDEQRRLFTSRGAAGSEEQTADPAEDAFRSKQSNRFGRPLSPARASIKPRPRNEHLQKGRYPSRWPSDRGQRFERFPGDSTYQDLETN